MHLVTNQIAKKKSIEKYIFSSYSARFLIYLGCKVMRNELTRPPPTLDMRTVPSQSKKFVGKSYVRTLLFITCLLLGLLFQSEPSLINEAKSLHYCPHVPIEYCGSWPVLYNQERKAMKKNDSSKLFLKIYNLEEALTLWWDLMPKPYHSCLPPSCWLRDIHKNQITQ